MIRWSSPIPAFGNLSTANVATIGINPSNREFVNSKGKELKGEARRFHTLYSLGIDSWMEADARHLDAILETCALYFMWNPYDAWFKRLDYVIGGIGGSYYGLHANACHLDLIPYATRRKWMDLNRVQRRNLLGAAADTLALLLHTSQIRVIVLNGQSVVDHFQQIANIVLDRQRIEAATLSRSSGLHVAGFGYRGLMTSLSGIPLQNPVLVLGYNHNLQSSFGITKCALAAVKSWLSDEVKLDSS